MATGDRVSTSGEHSHETFGELLLGLLETSMLSLTPILKTQFEVKR
jgi:hypothetical protein